MVFHCLALAPGDDVDGVDSGRQSEAVADGGVFAVLLADVLLVLIYEYRTGHSSDKQAGAACGH